MKREIHLSLSRGTFAGNSLQNAMAMSSARKTGYLGVRATFPRARVVEQRVSHDNSRHARGTEKQVDAFICREMHKLHAARGFSRINVAYVREQQYAQTSIRKLSAKGHPRAE